MTDKLHSHDFVETYEGVGAFGMGRNSDEETVKYLLQKFADDTMLATLIPRLSDAELGSLHDMVYNTMRSHMSEKEYHKIFLKEDEDGHHHLL